MKQLTNSRLASKAAGDDITLTRFVRTNQETRKPRHHQIGLPTLETPFVRDGRTKFPTTVKRVIDTPSLLVSGHSNIKIGRDVRKGRFRGYWIYTLSFEERATCPRSCAHWQSCYGNNMPFAKRLDHTDPTLLPALEQEIEQLLSVRGREGILIRLHALGDFYSTEYVEFWERMLAKHERLAIFGYTAHNAFSDIGLAVYRLFQRFGYRAVVRFSNGNYARLSTVPIAHAEDRPADAFVCPEQTGQTQCCATCGACWSTLKNVAFLAH